MIRRWCISLTSIALVSGSLMAAAGSASASVSAHPGATAARGGTATRGWTPGGLMQRPAGAAAPIKAAHGLKHQTTSTNWSGYAVTGSNGAFSRVSASWTEPAATCSKGNQYASFWVGLDGYDSNSVEQTGTDSDCSGRTAEYYGWYEMYPAYPVNFSNPVSPGDKISASVTFSGTQTYTLVLTDTTKGWTQTITQNQGGLDRSSAEVITEAPSSGSVLPLANFGTINYTASSDNGSSMGTQSPIEIVMVNKKGADKDTTSAMTSAGAFSNTWLSAR